MDLNRSFICHIDLSVFSCSLSQFLSLVFSICSKFSFFCCLLNFGFIPYFALFCRITPQLLLFELYNVFVNWELSFEVPCYLCIFGPLFFFAWTFTKFHCIWTSLGCIFMFGFTSSQWLKVWESHSHSADLSSCLSSDPDFMVLLTENSESIFQCAVQL